MGTQALHDRAQSLRDHRVPFVHARVVLAERPTSAKPGDEALVTADGEHRRLRRRPVRGVDRAQPGPLAARLGRLDAAADRAEPGVRPAGQDRGAQPVPVRRHARDLPGTRAAGAARRRARREPDRAGHVGRRVVPGLRRRAVRRGRRVVGRRRARRDPRQARGGDAHRRRPCRRARTSGSSRARSAAPRWWARSSSPTRRRPASATRRASTSARAPRPRSRCRCSPR